MCFSFETEIIKHLDMNHSSLRKDYTGAKTAGHH